jgi:branched-chain amino acid transport system ATP-binding protein
MRAIQIIEDEHRSLAAVLHGLLYLVREIRVRGEAPDFELLGAMLHYIDAFPERFHHPKEDAYLFRKLRERDPSAGALLDQLEAEHVEGRRLIQGLKDALARCQHERGNVADFTQRAADFASFHWDHMRREETEVMPRSRLHLTAQDWAEIDAAFADNNDPMLGADARDSFRQLFRRIVNLAPPPLGVGPAR